MNRQELVKKVMHSGDWCESGVMAEEAINAVLEGIAEGLKADGEVKLPIGTFKVKDIAARKARNPQTGESVDVPEKKKISFKPSKKFLSEMEEVAG